MRKLTCFVVITLITIAQSFGANLIVSLTNWDNTLTTNQVVITNVSDIYQDGTFLVTGYPHWYKTTNGTCTISNMFGGNYALGLQNYPFAVPYLFDMPDQSDTNTYLIQDRRISGGNLFAKTGVRQIKAGTNIVINPVNGQGCVTISSGTNGGTFLTGDVTGPNTATVVTNVQAGSIDSSRFNAPTLQEFNLIGGIADEAVSYFTNDVIVTDGAAGNGTYVWGGGAYGWTGESICFATPYITNNGSIWILYAGCASVSPVYTCPLAEFPDGPWSTTGSGTDPLPVVAYGLQTNVQINADSGNIISDGIYGNLTVNTLTITGGGGLTNAGPVMATAFSGNGAGLTNLSGANIQSGSINSNTLDAPTRAQLALAGQVATNAPGNFNVKSNLYVTGGQTNTGSGYFSGALEVFNGFAVDNGLASLAGGAILSGKGLTVLGAQTNYGNIYLAASSPLSTIYGNGGGLTNLNGANIQSGSINSNKLDAATQAQLALAGTGGGGSAYYGPNFTNLVVAQSNTGPALTFTTLQNGNATDLISIQPTNVAGMQPFNMWMQPFDSPPTQVVPDYVLNFGWGQNAGGGQLNSTQQVLYVQMEPWYQAFPGAEPQVEYHIDVCPTKGSMAHAVERPFFISANDTNIVTELFSATTYTFNSDPSGTNGATFTISSNLATVGGLLLVNGDQPNAGHGVGSIVIQDYTNDAFINFGANGSDQCHFGTVVAAGDLSPQSKAGDTCVVMRQAQTFRVTTNPGTGPTDAFKVSPTNVVAVVPLIVSSQGGAPGETNNSLTASSLMASDANNGVASIVTATTTAYSAPNASMTWSNATINGSITTSNKLYLASGGGNNNTYIYSPDSSDIRVIVGSGLDYIFNYEYFQLGAWGADFILKGPDAGTGNSNRNGQNLDLEPGSNTGSGTGGALYLFAGAPSSSSGSSINPNVPICTVTNTGLVMLTNSVSLTTNAPLPVATVANCWLWNSNSYLYWITTSHPNGVLIAAP